VVVARDAIRTHQHQQIRALLGLAGIRRIDRLFMQPGNPPFHFLPDPHRQQAWSFEHHAIGMKDQAGGRTFDVNGPAVIAVPANVGNEGIGLLVAFAQGAKVTQGLLHALQLSAQAGQLPLGGVHFLAGFRDAGPPHGQLFLLVYQLSHLGFQA